MVVVDKENFMGGTGTAHFEHVMMADEMHGMHRYSEGNTSWSR